MSSSLPCEAVTQPVAHSPYHWDTFSFVCSTNNPSSLFARGCLSPLHNNLFGHEDSENASGIPSFLLLFFFTFFCFNIHALSWLTWCDPQKMKSSSSAQMETTRIKNKPPCSWRCPLGVQIKSSWTLYEESPLMPSGKNLIKSKFPAAWLLMYNLIMLEEQLQLDKAPFLCHGLEYHCLLFSL